jgi:hypothetical protein
MDEIEFDEIENLIGDLTRIAGELCYVYKNKHQQDRIKKSEATGKLVALHYKLNPELIPFSGGIDRAKLFGKESAHAFALRKWGDQDYNDRFGNHNQRKNNPRSKAMLKRLEAKRERRQVLEDYKSFASEHGSSENS